MTIKLSDLKAARAAMTLNWTCDSGSARIALRDTNGVQRDDVFLDDYRDATGIVATHSAADVLIEIAATALALSAAGEAFAKCKWPKGSEFRRRLEIAAMEAERVHLEALAKVSL